MEAVAELSENRFRTFNDLEVYGLRGVFSSEQGIGNRCDRILIRFLE